MNPSDQRFVHFFSGGTGSVGKPLVALPGTAPAVKRMSVTPEAGSSVLQVLPLLVEYSALPPGGTLQRAVDELLTFLYCFDDGHIRCDAIGRRFKNQR